MHRKQKRQVKNRLALFRRRRSLGAKQVATLLGHKSTVQLSHYENGFKVPNLKNALKLAAIYNIPIRLMLDGYYESCVSEVRNEERGRDILRKVNTPNPLDASIEFEPCALEEQLFSKDVLPRTIDKVRQHATYLIRLTAEKQAHMEPTDSGQDEKP